MSVGRILRYCRPALLICSMLHVSSSAYAAPPPVPQCSTLTVASIGSMCYEATEVGVRVKRGDDKESFKNIFQATQPEYVLVDIQIGNRRCSGSYKCPTKNMLSPGGISSVASTARRRLTQIQQIRGEAEAKAATISGPGYAQAQAKVEALKREEKTYESMVQEMTAAGQDAGKYEVVGWAKPHSCGVLGTDECGSWSEATVFIIKRYIGSDADAYRRVSALANETAESVRQLALSSPSPEKADAPSPESQPHKIEQPSRGAVQCPAGSLWNGSVCLGSVVQPVPQSETPAPGGLVQCPAGSVWNGSVCLGTVVQPAPQSQVPPPGGFMQCPMGTVWNGQVCVVQPNQSPQQQGCAPNENPILCLLKGVMAPRY